MKLKTDRFREACTAIKSAIDSKGGSLFTETLELVGGNDVLQLHVTNREYYVSVDFNTTVTDFKAAVNAKLFLDLISKITTDEIDLEATDKFVKVTGNGDYKIPLVFNGDKLMELPKIESPTSNVVEMAIDEKTLMSILVHNSKELQRGTPVKPVQKYYYVDETGAITFTSGACVNSFTLPAAVKMLLSDKVVKLFKLFKDAGTVNFTYGANSQNQTVISFYSGGTFLEAILQDADLVSAVPVTAIRGMATKTYTNEVEVNKTALLDALHRMKLFSAEKTYGTFTFTTGNLSIKDWSGESAESVPVTGAVSEPYSAILNINGLELIVSGCEEDTLKMAFGDGRAVVIRKSTVTDIIPELKQS